MSGTQQRPAGGGRSVRVPHPKPGFRQTRRVLQTVTEKVSTALILGETPQGRNRHGKDAADVIKAWKMMPMTSSPLLAASCSHSDTCNGGD